MKIISYYFVQYVLHFGATVFCDSHVAILNKLPEEIL